MCEGAARRYSNQDGQRTRTLIKSPPSERRSKLRVREPSADGGDWGARGKAGKDLAKTARRNESQ